MAISRDVSQIISILQEEGFEALAGELLAEISRGREVEKPDSVDVQRSMGEPATVIQRVPIAEEEQLREAMSFLRLRLVDPVRAFAQAERIASELADAPGTRIRFIDPVVGNEIE